MSFYLKNKWSKELLMRLQQTTTGKIIYVDGTYGSDSGSGLYPFDAKATVQGGVDAVTTNRGDVVIVGAGRYYENVRITKSKMTLMGAQTGGKQSVSIRPGGAGGGSPHVVEHAEATTRYGYSSLGGETIRASAVTVNAASVEICGLQFDASDFEYTDGNYRHYGGVYIGDGTRINASYNEDCNGSYVHDCIFKRGYIGLHYDGASEDHRCENNLFYRQTAGSARGSIFIDPGSSRQCERILIAYNTFMAIDTGSYGVFGYNTAETHDCIIAHNIFQARDGKTIGDCIYYKGAGGWLLAGNYYGCADAQSASLDTGGYTAGNYMGVAGADPVAKYLKEA